MFYRYGETYCYIRLTPALKSAANVIFRWVVGLGFSKSMSAGSEKDGIDDVPKLDISPEED